MVRKVVRNVEHQVNFAIWFNQSSVKDCCLGNSGLWENTNWGLKQLFIGHTFRHRLFKSRRLAFMLEIALQRHSFSHQLKVVSRDRMSHCHKHNMLTFFFLINPTLGTVQFNVPTIQIPQTKVAYLVPNNWYDFSQYQWIVLFYQTTYGNV